MAFFEDMFKGDPLTGVVVGIGAVVLAPTVGRVLRPAAKAVIKGGIVLYRQTFAEVGEAMSDLVAEARTELEQGEAHDQATLAPGESSERRNRPQVTHTARPETH